MLQPQSLIVPNVSQQIYQSLTSNLPGFDEKVAKCFTIKLKSTLVDKKLINDAIQAL